MEPQVAKDIENVTGCVMINATLLLVYKGEIELAIDLGKARRPYAKPGLDWEQNS
jgi:hypothetical protein